MTKHRTNNLHVVAISAIIIIGLCTSTISKSAKNANNMFEQMTVEAEDMVLTSAKVLAIDSASGGKVVKMLAKDAMATTKLILPKGEYAAGVFFMGLDLDSDGFYLVANSKVRRSNTHRHKQWQYGNRFVTFKSDGTSPVVLHIASAWEGEASAEWGMLIDRMEIVEYCSSAEVLERWTK